MPENKLITIKEALKRAWEVFIKNESLGFIVKAEALMALVFTVVATPLFVAWIGLSIYSAAAYSTESMPTAGDAGGRELLDEESFNTDFDTTNFTIPENDTPEIPQAFGPVLIVVLVVFALIVVAYFVTYTNLNLLVQLRLYDGNLTGVVSLFKQALRAMPKMLALLIIQGFVIFLGFLLFIIPGIILSIKYMFSPYVLLNENCGPFEAMAKSSSLTKGYKLSIYLKTLGLLCLQILLIVPLGLVAALTSRMGIGTFLMCLYALFMQLLWVFIYKDLIRIKSAPVGASTVVPATQ